MTEIAELVVQAQGGDRQAFALLYDQFAPLIRSIGYDATGALPEAEDLCQEVFLQAYGKLGQLRDPERFAGWLVSIARRCGTDWQRRRGRQPRRGLEGLDPPDRQSDSLEEETALLLQALRRLPEKERLALHLVYLAEQPATSARALLGLSNAGFYKLLARAKRRLATSLHARRAVQ